MGVATQIGMNRGERPLHQPGSEKFILPIQHMLARFRSFDPPTEKKLACHPDLPLFAVTNVLNTRYLGGSPTTNGTAILRRVSRLARRKIANVAPKTCHHNQGLTMQIINQ